MNFFTSNPRHAPAPPKVKSPVAGSQATFSGIVVGMLPSRSPDSVEVAIKVTDSDKIYDCTVPLSLAREANLEVGVAVEVIGVEAAPQYVRAVGLAVFR